MPKPIQPPAPAYGSDAWKAERAKMVGTPEWKAATGYVESQPQGDPMAQGGRLTDVALPFSPFGKTLTTAERQAQSPMYNPLYDPRSAEYKANLIQMSQPKVQSPLVKSPNAPVSTPQLPASDTSQSPLVKPSGSTPITLPEMFQQNYNMGPQQQAQQGIKMPNIQKPLQGFGGGSNWTDFLTVANNRQMR